MIIDAYLKISSDVPVSSGRSLSVALVRSSTPPLPQHGACFSCRSSAVEMILRTAKQEGKKFTVCVMDSGPAFEGSPHRSFDCTGHQPSWSTSLPNCLFAVGDRIEIEVFF